MLLGFCLASFGILFCSVVFGCRTHLKLLDRVVSGACFLAGGVLNCNLSHRRSVAVLCMLYRIRCNPMHPLCGALPVPYMPVRVTRGALIAHRYTYAPHRCKTSQYRTLLFPSQYLSGTIWLTSYSAMWDWRGSRAGQMPFSWPSCSLLFCLQLFSLSLLLHYKVGSVGLGSSDWYGVNLPLPALHCQSFLIIIIIITSIRSNPN